MEHNNSDSFKSAWIIPFILKYKWLLLISGVTGALFVFIACLMTTPRYQASAIVYAAGMNATNPMTLTEGNSMLLLQLLESSYLKDSLIKRLDLASHYQINPSKKSWMQSARNEYDKNVSFKRTLYKSIKIRVLDHDPEFAAEMANAIVETSNEINTKIVKENTLSQLKSFEEAYQKKQKDVDTLVAEISVLKNESVDHVSAQLLAQLEIRKKAINHLRIKLNEIRTDLGVHGLSQQLDEVQKRYTHTQSRYRQESARLAVYEERLSPSDSLRIISEGMFAGLSNDLESLKIQLDNLVEANDEYLRITNELALEIQMRDQLIRRIEVIKNTFEPGVHSIEMHKKEKLFEAELEHLASLKSNYEKAKNSFNKIEPGSYLISEATPNYNQAYPNTLLFTVTGFFLSLFLSFFGLLLFRKE